MLSWTEAFLCAVAPVQADPILLMIRKYSIRGERQGRVFEKCQNTQNCHLPRSSPHSVSGVSYNLVAPARVNTVSSCLWLLPNTFLIMIPNFFAECRGRRLCRFSDGVSPFVATQS